MSANGSQAAIGPRVERLDEQDHAGCELVLAGHQGALDRRGATPARELRRVQVEPRHGIEQRPGHELAVGDHRHRTETGAGQLGLRLRRPLGLQQRAGRARAPVRRPARGRSARPRPAGRSGCESTRAISSAGSPASSVRHSAAQPLVPANPIRGAGQPRWSGRGRRARIASRRASGVVRSKISTPSRWSISCWITRDCRPSASMRTGSPSASAPSTTIVAKRSTGTWTSGSERQPSPSAVTSSDCSTITGFTRTPSSSSSSARKTRMRRSRPSWVAARPTPWASSMTRPIRPTSARRSSENSSTSRARSRSTGSG